MQVINGNVPHTLLAPFTGSLGDACALISAKGSLPLVLGFDPAIVSDPDPSPGGAVAAVCLACFCVLYGICRDSRGFRPVMAT